jgi:MFS family permease
VYALIFGRIVQSLGLSAAGVVGAGSLADVYPPAIRGNAMVRSAFTASWSS